MPGYGGLEVCQRIKEAPETARIPVLLTVGKLEPFKPDEARRVGADAFIIKPFEATELLTALTKLEDKIVAGAAAPEIRPLRQGTGGGRASAATISATRKPAGKIASPFLDRMQSASRGNGSAGSRCRPRPRS